MYHVCQPTAGEDHFNFDNMGEGGEDCLRMPSPMVHYFAETGPKRILSIQDTNTCELDTLETRHGTRGATNALKENPNSDRKLAC